LVRVSKIYFLKRITDLKIIVIFTYNLKLINMKFFVIEVIFGALIIAFVLIVGVAFLEYY
jgi:hypothetical protein